MRPDIGFQTCHQQGNSAAPMHQCGALRAFMLQGWQWIECRSHPVNSLTSFTDSRSLKFNQPISDRPSGRGVQAAWFHIW